MENCNASQGTCNGADERDKTGPQGAFTLSFTPVHLFIPVTSR